MNIAIAISIPVHNSAVQRLATVQRRWVAVWGAADACDAVSGVGTGGATGLA